MKICFIKINLLVILILLFYLFAFEVKGDQVIGDDGYVFYKKVNLSYYSPSEIEIKKSLFYAFGKRNWKIIEHSRYKIKAKYKRSLLEVTIKNFILEFREVPITPSAIFKDSWLDNLEVHIIGRLEYYRNVRDAERFISSEKKVNR